MSWNYRIIKNKCPDTEEIMYQIFEVYYDDQGEIDCWSSEPDTALGDSVPDLKEDLLHQLEALEKPVLIVKQDGEDSNLVEENQEISEI